MDTEMDFYPCSSTEIQIIMNRVGLIPWGKYLHPYFNKIYKRSVNLITAPLLLHAAVLPVCQISRFAK
jgi:hypothetical protein